MSSWSISDFGKKKKRIKEKGKKRNIPTLIPLESESLNEAVVRGFGAIAISELYILMVRK